jgi:hypothetical protein
MSTTSSIDTRTRRETAVMSDDDEINPTRVRIGLAMVAFTIIVSIGVLLTVESTAAKFLFTAILVIGLFQTWRIFRAQRRR